MLIAKLLLVVLIYIAIDLVEKEAELEDQHHLV